MEAIDLKERRSFVAQYVELRNSHRDVLLTREVSLPETLAWLDRTDVEIRCLVDNGVIAGAVLLYPEKGGEIAIFVKEPGQGLGSRLLNRNSPALRYLAQGSYPVYILHQTVIVVLAFYIVGMSAPWGVHWITLLVASVALTFLCYEGLRRVCWLRFLFGMRPLPSPQPAPPE